LLTGEAVPLASAIDAVQCPLRTSEAWIMRAHQKIKQPKKRRAREVFHDALPVAIRIRDLAYWSSWDEDVCLNALTET